MLAFRVPLPPDPDGSPQVATNFSEDFADVVAGRADAIYCFDEVRMDAVVDQIHAAFRERNSKER